MVVKKCNIETILTFVHFTKVFELRTCIEQITTLQEIVASRHAFSHNNITAVEHIEGLCDLSVPRAPLFLQSLQRCNSIADWATELFKPSAGSASLLVQIGKKKFRFGFAVFWWWRHNEGTLSHFWLSLPSPGRQSIEPCFWLKFFWQLGKNPRLWSPWLNCWDIWSQNFGTKTQFLKKFKKFHKKYNLPSQGKFWPTITWQQIELESCSNRLKTPDVL